MKKKLIIILCIIGVLIGGKQAFNYFYNESLVEKYADGDYSMSSDTLKFINCFQPYIAYYNSGNVCYQKGDYAGAVKDYEAALAKNPPKEKECSIRINLALSMVYGLGEDYAESENVSNSIKVLKEAKAVLLEKDCATEDGDGHNDTAEELKEEIEELIEELEKEPEAPNQPQDPNEPDEPDEPDEPEKPDEEKIKDKLQQLQNESFGERNEGLKFYEEMYKDINFDYEGPIW